MRKTIYILLIAALMSIHIVSSDYIYKQNDDITLIQTCENCTYVNITSLTAPNSTILVSDASMTKTHYTYNYTFSDTSSLGTYTVCGVGDLDNSDAVWCYDFKITKDGQDTSTNIGAMVALSLFTITFVVMGMVLLFRGGKDEK